MHISHISFIFVLPQKKEGFRKRQDAGFKNRWEREGWSATPPPRKVWHTMQAYHILIIFILPEIEPFDSNRRLKKRLITKNTDTLAHHWSKGNIWGEMGGWSNPPPHSRIGAQHTYISYVFHFCLPQKKEGSRRGENAGVKKYSIEL